MKATCYLDRKSAFFDGLNNKNWGEKKLNIRKLLKPINNQNIVKIKCLYYLPNGSLTQNRLVEVNSWPIYGKKYKFIVLRLI